MQSETIIKVLKALADPTRLDIVRTVRKQGGSSSCSRVSECSELSQPAMSHHFAKLVEAGVLVDHKDGVSKYYEINTSLLTSLGIDITKL